MNAARTIQHGITESIHFDRIEVVGMDMSEDYPTYDALASYIDDVIPGATEVMAQPDQVTGLFDGSAFWLRMDHLIVQD